MAVGGRSANALRIMQKLTAPTRGSANQTEYPPYIGNLSVIVAPAAMLH